MMRRLFSYLVTGLFMLCLVGLTNKAMAIPIEYKVTGRAAYLIDGPEKYGYGDFYGHLIVDGTPTGINPGTSVLFDVLDFALVFDLDNMYQFDGNDGYLKHGVHNTDLALYGTGDIDFMSATDMQASNMSEDLLDTYHLVESFQITPRVAFIQEINLEQNPVPEPATIFLLGVGLVGLSGTKFRRKK